MNPRVLHLNTAKTWRGGERQVLFLAQGLRDVGPEIQQLVVGRPDSELQARCEEAGLPFRAVRMGGEWDLLAARRIRNIAREFGANLVHAHTSRAHGLGLMAVRGLPKTKLIVSRRVDFPAGTNFLSRRKYLSPHVAMYIAISENVKRILMLDGIPEERIRIAYSGIDLERFEKKHDATAIGRLRAELGLADETIVFGNVAMLVGHKDQKTLVAATAELARRKDQLPAFHVLIAGEGKLRESLEVQADAAGLLEGGFLTFTGYRNDVDDLYGLFDVFVMSSNEEGLGTAVLDAMGYGLPVAATAAGGIPEMIVDGEGGLLSPAEDPGALAENMARLLTDAGLRAKFGNLNRERVKKFSKEATVRDTMAVYREVLEGR